MRFIFPGEPIAQQRPRFSRKTACAYDPQAKEKKALRLLAISQMAKNGFKMLSDAALQAEVYAYSTPPASWPQKRLKCVLEEESNFKGTKPDIDNIAKLYLDILSGIAYSDDKQIAKLICEKRYAKEPRTKVFISKI